MNNIEKEYLYLMKRLRNHGEADALRDVKHGGFFSVEEKDGDLFYRDKDGDFAVISKVRLERSLVEEGAIPYSRIQEEWPDKETIEKHNKPLNDYLKKLREAIAANPDFDYRKDVEGIEAGVYSDVWEW